MCHWAYRQLEKLANIYTRTDIFHSVVQGQGENGVKPITLRLRISHSTHWGSSLTEKTQFSWFSYSSRWLLPMDKFSAHTWPQRGVQKTWRWSSEFQSNSHLKCGWEVMGWDCACLGPGQNHRSRNEGPLKKLTAFHFVYLSFVDGCN
jgi:hypothetical protein